MLRMEAHAKAMGTEIIGDIITELNLEQRPFLAQGDSGAIYSADARLLVIFVAVGAEVTASALRASRGLARARRRRVR